MQLLEDFGRDYQRYRHSIKEKSFLGLNGLQHVLSSNVSAVGIKDTALVIRFHNGSVYEYPGRADDYEKILNSNSKGKWVWRNLRRKKAPYKKTGKLPLPDDIGVTDEDIFQEIDNRYAKDLTKHVNVPVFQSFEFINGMSMQKILVGDIAAYVPVIKPIPVEKSFKEIRQDIEIKLKDRVKFVFTNDMIANKDMVEQSGTQLEKLFKTYNQKVNTISFGSEELRERILGQSEVEFYQAESIALDRPLHNNPSMKVKILIKADTTDQYTRAMNNGWLTQVDKENIPIATATHEFAHTLWQSTYHARRKKHLKRFGIPKDKEIEAGDKLIQLFRQYKKAVENDESIRFGRYSLVNVNEFLAEGFTNATLSSNPSPYAVQVKKIIDTYIGVNNDN